MPKRRRKIPWPPLEGGVAFVQSEAFGTLLVKIVDGFRDQYSHMDFTDAVAQVFEWFSGRLAKEPDFLEDRFVSAAAFRAYLRQAIWNAGRLAARRRARGRDITSLSPDAPIRAEEISAEELAELSEAVARLPHPHKDILERIFFDEEADVLLVASSMGMDLETYYEFYEEAIDMLQRDDAL